MSEKSSIMKSTLTYSSYIGQSNASHKLSLFQRSVTLAIVAILSDLGIVIVALVTAVSSSPGDESRTQSFAPGASNNSLSLEQVDEEE